MKFSWRGMNGILKLTKNSGTALNKVDVKISGGE